MTDARRSLQFRPWIRNAIWDRLTRTTVQHSDAWLYSDGFTLYARLITSRGGKAIDNENCYVADPHRGTLHLVPEIPANARPIYDASPAMIAFRSNGCYQRVHKKLVELAAMRKPGYNTVSTKLHYVQAMDIAPFPADFVNHYKAKVPLGADRRRKRSVPAKTALPDIL